MKRTLLTSPRWLLRLQFWWHRWGYMGWCMFFGHRPPVRSQLGAPVVPAVLVCPRCGNFERAS